MITRLGEVEEGPKPRKAPSILSDGSLYRAKVVAPGGRYGQVVDVVEIRRGGEVVCVYEGNRFMIQESSLQKVRSRGKRARKKAE